MRLRIGVSPMRIWPLQHFQQIAKCRSPSLLPPPSWPLPEIRGLLRANNTKSAQPEVISHRSDHPEECNFRNTGFPDTASGGDMRSGGRDCPFSEHEAGVHTAPDQGVAKFFISRRRTRLRLEGEGDSKKTPAFLA